MNWIKRLWAASLAVVALLCLLSSPLAFATAPTGYVTVSGYNTVDSTGTLIANATISFAPVTNAGIPVSFRVGSSAGGQASYAAVTATVTAGVFNIQLADTALTNPTNICYNVTIVDNVTGNSLLGPGYTCVQPQAQSTSYWCNAGTKICDFDTYIPALTNQLTVVAGPTGPAGPAGAVGPAGLSNGMINVMASPYNAVCNGTTDDSAAIQAAITAGETATGIAGFNTVLIPASCAAHGLRMSGYMSLTGNGPGVSRLILNDATANLLTVVPTPLPSWNIPGQGSVLSLALAGGDSATSGTLLEIDGTQNIDLEHDAFLDNGGKGLEVNGSGERLTGRHLLFSLVRQSIALNGAPNEVHLEDFRSVFSGYTYRAGTTTPYCYGLNCTAGVFAASGALVPEPNAQVYVGEGTNIHFSDCSIKPNEYSAGFQDYFGGVTLQSCYIEQAYQNVGVYEGGVARTYTLATALTTSSTSSTVTSSLWGPHYGSPSDMAAYPDYDYYILKPNDYCGAGENDVNGNPCSTTYSDLDPGHSLGIYEATFEEIAVTGFTTANAFTIANRALGGTTAKAWPVAISGNSTQMESYAGPYEATLNLVDDHLHGVKAPLTGYTFNLDQSNGNSSAEVVAGMIPTGGHSFIESPGNTNSSWVQPVKLTINNPNMVTGITEQGEILAHSTVIMDVIGLNGVPDADFAAPPYIIALGPSIGGSYAQAAAYPNGTNAEMRLVNPESKMISDTNIANPAFEAAIVSSSIDTLEGPTLQVQNAYNIVGGPGLLSQTAATTLASGGSLPANTNISYRQAYSYYSPIFAITSPGMDYGETVVTVNTCPNGRGFIGADAPNHGALVVHFQPGAGCTATPPGGGAIVVSITNAGGGTGHGAVITATMGYQNGPISPPTVIQTTTADKQFTIPAPGADPANAAAGYLTWVGPEGFEMLPASPTATAVTASYTVSSLVTGGTLVPVPSCQVYCDPVDEWQFAFYPNAETTSGLYGKHIDPTYNTVTTFFSASYDNGTTIEGPGGETLNGCATFTASVLGATSGACLTADGTTLTTGGLTAVSGVASGNYGSGLTNGTYNLTATSGCATEPVISVTVASGQLTGNPTVVTPGASCTTPVFTPSTGTLPTLSYSISSTASVTAVPATAITTGTVSTSRLPVGTNSTASTPTLGIVEADGTSISASSSGVLSVPTATSSALGLVRPGSGCTISSGVITCAGSGSAAAAGSTYALQVNSGSGVFGAANATDNGTNFAVSEAFTALSKDGIYSVDTPVSSCSVPMTTTNNGAVNITHYGPYDCGWFQALEYAIINNTNAAVSCGANTAGISGRSQTPFYTSFEGMAGPVNNATISILSASSDLCQITSNQVALYPSGHAIINGLTPGVTSPIGDGTGTLAVGLSALAISPTVNGAGLGNGVQIVQDTATGAGACAIPPVVAFALSGGQADGYEVYYRGSGCPASGYAGVFPIATTGNGILTAAIATGGTGLPASSTITATDSSGSCTGTNAAPKLTITTNSSGVATAVTIPSAGYNCPATGSYTPTFSFGGSGTQPTFTLTMGTQQPTLTYTISDNDGGRPFFALKTFTGTNNSLQIGAIKLTNQGNWEGTFLASGPQHSRIGEITYRDKQVLGIYTPIVFGCDPANDTFCAGVAQSSMGQMQLGGIMGLGLPYASLGQNSTVPVITTTVSGGSLATGTDTGCSIQNPGVNLTTAQLQVFYLNSLTTSTLPSVSITYSGSTGATALHCVVASGGSGLPSNFQLAVNTIPQANYQVEFRDVWDSPDIDGGTAEIQGPGLKAMVGIGITGLGGDAHYRNFHPSDGGSSLAPYGVEVAIPLVELSGWSMDSQNGGYQIDAKATEYNGGVTIRDTKWLWNFGTFTNFVAYNFPGTGTFYPTVSITENTCVGPGTYLVSGVSTPVPYSEYMDDTGPISNISKYGYAWNVRPCADSNKPWSTFNVVPADSNIFLSNWQIGTQTPATIVPERSSLMSLYPRSGYDAFDVYNGFVNNTTTPTAWMTGSGNLSLTAINSNLGSQYGQEEMGTTAVPTTFYRTNVDAIANLYVNQSAGATTTTLGGSGQALKVNNEGSGDSLDLINTTLSGVTALAATGTYSLTAGTFAVTDTSGSCTALTGGTAPIFQVTVNTSNQVSAVGILYPGNLCPSGTFTPTLSLAGTSQPTWTATVGSQGTKYETFSVLGAAVIGAYPTTSASALTLSPTGATATGTVGTATELLLNVAPSQNAIEAYQYGTEVWSISGSGHFSVPIVQSFAGSQYGQETLGSTSNPITFNRTNADSVGVASFNSSGTGTALITSNTGGGAQALFGSGGTQTTVIGSSASNNGLIATYDGLTTAGLGVPILLGSWQGHAVTASVANTSVNTGASTTAFQMRATAYCQNATGSGTATLAFVYTYTDPFGNVQTVSPTASTCPTSGDALIQLDSPLMAENGTTITWHTTASTSPVPTYHYEVQVLQQNNQ